MRKTTLRCVLSFTFIFIYLITCKAVESGKFIDSHAYSMGNTSSVLPGFTNPASSGFILNKSFSLEYLNRFGIKELSSFGCILNYPNKYLNTGLYVSRYGFSDYNETSFSANFYKALSKTVSLGIRMNYLGIHYSDKEQDATSLTGDVGLLVRTSDYLNLSFLVINPLRTEIKMGEESAQLSNVLTMGISFQPEDMFLLTGEIEKDFAQPVIYKFGMEYVPVKELSLRAGMWTKPFSPSFGFGLNLNPFTVNMAFNNHPVLGFNSCCGLQFNF